MCNDLCVDGEKGEGEGKRKIYGEAEENEWMQKEEFDRGGEKEVCREKKWGNKHLQSMYIFCSLRF